jgi:uncharacterized protein YkwD
MPQTPAQAGGFVLGLWIAVWLLLPWPAAGEPLTLAGAGGFDALEAALHASVNGVRAQAGLVSLRRDPALDAVARAHSEDMATRGYFAHETPEGLTPPDRLKRAGVRDVRLAGENVGLTSRGDPNREILQGWLASPAHRQNLLAPVFDRAGVGIARAADGTLFYTQLYAR